VEHNSIVEWAASLNIPAGDDRLELLCRYARLVVESNRKFNLTGYSSIEEVEEGLIINSIDPLKGLNVPRGTSFVDIGTGAGVPGLPLSIFHRGLRGLLLDSNTKKIRFIQGVVADLGLNNVEARSIRLEEAGHKDELRGKFDFLFARALGNPYFTIEMGAPLLKEGGHLYMYSNIRAEDLHGDVLHHGERLGVVIVESGERDLLGISHEGLLFKKISATADAYPRRFSVVKRESKRYQ